MPEYGVIPILILCELTGRNDVGQRAQNKQQNQDKEQNMGHFKLVVLLLRCEC